MKRAFALAVGSLVFLAGSPAHAVPGFAYYNAQFTISVPACTARVQQAVRAAVGATAQPSGNFSPMASVTAGYTTDTAVFVQCIANPDLVCGVPSSTLFIVAFSDAGSGKALTVRQQVQRGFGTPQTLNCGDGSAAGSIDGGVARNPVPPE